MSSSSLSSRLTRATALTPARLARATHGDAVVEYGLLVGGITVGAIFSVLALGQTVPEAYDNPPDALPPHCEVSVEQFVELYGTGQLPPECMVDNPGNDMFVPHTPMDTSGTSMTLDPSDPRTADDPQDPDDGSYPYKAPELVCEGFACQLLASTTSGPGGPTSGPPGGPSSGPPPTSGPPTSGGTPPPGDGNWCPPYSNWTWDPIYDRWIVPGEALMDPILAGRAVPGGHIFSFGAPPEQVDFIGMPLNTIINWWGDYYGITFFIHETWLYSDTFYPGDIYRPSPSCPDVTYISGSTIGADDYPPYYYMTSGGTLVTSGSNWLEGTPSIESLDMNTAPGGPFDGVIGFQSRDTITDTSGSDYIIPGPGNDAGVMSNGGADTFIYKEGDGNDWYQPWNTGGGTDSVHILGLADDQVDFAWSNPEVQLTMPDGGQLSLSNILNAGVPGHQIEELRFANTVYDQQDILNRLVNDMKATGTVTGFPQSVAHTHAASIDGSYQINANSPSGSPDSLTFLETSWADIDVLLGDIRSGKDDLILRTPDGDEVMIDEFFDYGSRDIENLNFRGGVTPTEQELRDRMFRDQREDLGPGGGEVHLTRWTENMTHRSGDPFLEIYSESNRAETDRLNLPDWDINTIEVNGRLDENDVIIGSGSDRVEIHEYFHGATSRQLEEVVFSDGVVRTPGVSFYNRLADRMLDTDPNGFRMPTHTDTTATYTTSMGDPSEIASEGGASHTLVFADLAPSDVSFRIAGSEDMIIDLPTGDLIVGNHVDNTTSRRMETIRFEGGGSTVTMSFQDTIDKAMTDSLANGVSETRRTYFDDTISYDPATDAGGIEITNEYGGGTDIFETPATFSSARFRYLDTSPWDPARDLEIDFGGGQTLIFPDQAPSDSAVLDTYRFAGVDISLTDILARVVQDPLDDGRSEMHMTPNADTIDYRTADHGQIEIYMGYSNATTTDIFQTDDRLSDVTFGSMGDDLDIIASDGDRVRFNNFLSRSDADRIDEFIFDDGSGGTATYSAAAIAAMVP